MQKHYISHHINTTCRIISELWLLSLQELVHRVKSQRFICLQWSFVRISQERKEKGKKSYTSWVSIWDLLADRGVTLWKYKFSVFAPVNVYSFNDFFFFFLIGLTSLSLVLRAVSYFTLVPFHCSSYSNHFLQPPGWVILTPKL